MEKSNYWRKCPYACPDDNLDCKDCIMYFAHKKKSKKSEKLSRWERSRLWL